MRLETIMEAMVLTLEQLRDAVRARRNQMRLLDSPIQRVESAADMDLLLIFETLEVLLSNELGE